MSKHTGYPFSWIRHTALDFGVPDTDPDFKPCCYGCPFAGREFKCLSSDGYCLTEHDSFKISNGKFHCLDEDERIQIPVIDSMGRNQERTVVCDSGLYAVIIRSDETKAKAFRRWITSEILPFSS